MRSPREKRLAKGRKQRLRATQALRLLEDGKLSLRALIEVPPPEIKRVRLYHLLTRAPRLGEVGARKVCEEAQVWPLARVGTISASDREALLDALPKRVI